MYYGPFGVEVTKKNPIGFETIISELTDVSCITNHGQACKTCHLAAVTLDALLTSSCSVNVKKTLG